MSRFLSDTNYRGCPYIIFTAELTDRRHPARLLVERRTTQRRSWFRDRAAEAGAADPEFLAEQLDVLFDGALAAGLLFCIKISGALGTGQVNPDVGRVEIYHNR